MIMKLFFLVFIAISFPMFAGTVNLMNDASVPLTARIIGADGSMLGEVDVPPRSRKTWSGGWAGGKESLTPYTVRWMCTVAGTEYSVCESVSSGATISPQICPGPKTCPEPKQDEDQSPANLQLRR